ncbi:hypothetical protein D3C80_1431360 [compost metagenome]
MLSDSGEIRDKLTPNQKLRTKDSSPGQHHRHPTLVLRTEQSFPAHGMEFHTCRHSKHNSSSNQLPGTGRKPSSEFPFLKTRDIWSSSSLTQTSDACQYDERNTCQTDFCTRHSWFFSAFDDSYPE